MTTRSACAGLALLLMTPGAASAATAQDCSTAIGVPSSEISWLSRTDGNDLMIGVASSLGPWAPLPGAGGGTMCLLTTGLASDITLGQDYDHPGVGADTSAGDRVEVTWDLVVPAGINSFQVRSNFFSREYPEWVGSEFNDTFEISVIGAAFSGQAAFDSYGNPIQINSVLFAATNPSDLTGTGFDGSGATGWLVTAVPVTPLDTITVSLSVQDSADGVWDSAVLVDWFAWSGTVLPLPFTAHADDDGNPIGPDPTDPDPAPIVQSIAPNLIPLDGGPALTVLGAEFTDDVTVRLGDLVIDTYEFVDENTLIIPQAPSAVDVGVPGGGSVSLRVSSPNGVSMLPQALSYSEDAVLPLSIDSVYPPRVPAGVSVILAVDGQGLSGVLWSLHRDGIALTQDIGLAETTQLNAAGDDESTFTVAALEEGLYEVRGLGTDGSTDSGSFEVVAGAQADEPAPNTGCSQGRSPGTFWALVLLLPALLRRKRSKRRVHSMRTIFVASCLLSLSPLTAVAATAQDCSTALGVPGSSVSSLALTDGNEQMVGVRTALGAWTSFTNIGGSDMCLLSTGNVANITAMQDYDHPGTGADTSAGDRVEITWQLTVPAGTNSFLIRSNFFSREYPEWVGDSYNDTFEINVSGAAFTGQAAFDSAGNPVTVNNALFTVTNPLDLVGTGFDQDGATGWIVTSVPVAALDVITVSISIEDVADGVWDSAVLLHGFQWSSTILPLPFTAHTDDEGNPVGEPPVSDAPMITSVSPSIVPMDGGVEVVIEGGNLDTITDVFVGDVWVGWEQVDAGRIYIVSSPSASMVGVAAGDTVDVQVVGPSGTATVPDALTFVEQADVPNLELDAMTPDELVAELATPVSVNGRWMTDASFVVEGNGSYWDIEDVVTTEPNATNRHDASMLIPALPAGDYELIASSDAAGEASVSFSVVAVSEEDPAGAAGCSAVQARGGISALLLLGLLPLVRRRRS